MIDWDDAFANSAYIPGAEDIYAGWVARSRAFRAAHAPVVVQYGPGPREAMDVFVPKGTPRGLFVFVHGGYWHELDKSSWSFMAEGAVAQGYAVAVPSYPLAPLAGLPVIAQAVGAAISAAAARVDGAIFLAGHSAGGHLVARMICADGPLPSAVLARIRRVTSISGVHDLRPLLQTKMNDILGLTADVACAQSPALLRPADAGPDLALCVGAGERPEFLRQTRLMAEAWAPRIAAEVYAQGANHFTVLDSLAEPEGALCQMVLAAPDPRDLR